MKIIVSEASQLQLDYLVASTMGTGAYWQSKEFRDTFSPTTDWAQGGPIIEREGISVVRIYGGLGKPRVYWVAFHEVASFEWGYGPYHSQDEEKSLQVYEYETNSGQTPLIAAMRCYVASKLGDEVGVPEGVF